MLRLTLKINNDLPLLDVSIRRVSPDNPKKGEMCKYIVEDIHSPDTYEYLCFVECEFGSANKLVIKVLKELEKDVR